MAARTWTCRGCSGVNDSRKRKCGACGKPRPPKRRPAHRAVLDRPYEEWVAEFGEVCGICGRGPSERRRLDRDHCHTTGIWRGMLCHTCNRALGNRMDAEWAENAAAYLRSAELRAWRSEREAA